MLQIFICKKVEVKENLINEWRNVELQNGLDV